MLKNSTDIKLELRDLSDVTQQIGVHVDSAPRGLKSIFSGYEYKTTSKWVREYCERGRCGEANPKKVKYFYNEQEPTYSIKEAAYLANRVTPICIDELIIRDAIDCEEIECVRE